MQVRVELSELLSEIIESSLMMLLHIPENLLMVHWRHYTKAYPLFACANWGVMIVNQFAYRRIDGL